MTSALPPSASEDDEYAFNRRDATPAPAPTRSEHDQYVATARRSPVPVIVAVVVALLVIVGTVLAVLFVFGGRVV